LINPSQPNIEIGIEKFDLSTTINAKLNTFNLLMCLIYQQIYQLVPDIEYSTPIAINTLPVVGGFLNKLTCGVPLG
jgi:hypothetical protein